MNSKSSLYFDLIEALRGQDCAVCRLVDRDVRQYIDGLFYESLTIVERRAEIRAARGFCSMHGGILAGNARMLGIAIIHQDVINDVLRGIPAGETGNPLKTLFARAGNRVAEAVRPRRECTLCGHERHQERIVLELLLKHVREPEMRDAVGASGGLCLPHLEVAALLRAVPPGAFDALITLQRARLETLRGELERFIHKSNGSYERGAMGAEADAPARAARLVSGRVFGRRAP